MVVVSPPVCTSSTLPLKAQARLLLLLLCLRFTGISLFCLKWILGRLFGDFCQICWGVGLSTWVVPLFLSSVALGCGTTYLGSITAVLMHVVPIQDQGQCCGLKSFRASYGCVRFYVICFFAGMHACTHTCLLVLRVEMNISCSRWVRFFPFVAPESLGCGLLSCNLQVWYVFQRSSCFGALSYGFICN